MKYWVTAFLLVATGLARGQEVQNPAIQNRVDANPKNVIIVLAEGLGLTQISAGIYQNGNAHNIERFPITGLQKAQSADALIADAGSAATAISCGVATQHNLVGLNQKKKTVKNIFEDSKARGYSNGIISSAPLTSPAPAAFVAHRSLKAGEEAIAEAYLQGHVDFLIGGGRPAFTNRTADQRNLADEFLAKGFTTTAYHPDSISVTTFDFRNNFAAFFDTAANQHNNPDYILPAVRLGSVYLKNHSRKSGFILVVHYHHVLQSSEQNKSESLLSGMRMLDQIIGAVLDFASGDGETLVVLTGTPESGGFAIQPGSQMGEMTFKYGSTGLTGAMIPVFAFGPGAPLFMGVYDNTGIHQRIHRALGWR